MGEKIKEKVKRNIETNKKMRKNYIQTQKNRNRGMITAFKKAKGGPIKKARAALNFESLTGVGDKTRRDEVLKMFKEKKDAVQK